ncbi:MAG: transketolase, partial [Candidatus Izimaplasma sp.]|nr:transketolase [Candidatus Izimaplasma bacterium]
MDMKNFSNKIRLETLKMFKHRGFGHLGGSLSIVEVLSVLYSKIMKINPKDIDWKGRDYLVLSKGHAGPALYATLALKGYFDINWLMTLNDNKTNLPSHCDHLKTPGIDMTTGSLGQGISSAVGIAKALKFENASNLVFTIVGDGELNEGQCFEAIQFASHHKLDNLIIFVDENKIQLDGFTKDISDQRDLIVKFNAFGFHSARVDGHNEKLILEAINTAISKVGQPSVIVLDTVKGKGIEKFENIIGNHHMRFSKDDLLIIDKKIKELEEV